MLTDYIYLQDNIVVDSGQRKDGIWYCYRTNIKVYMRGEVCDSIMILKPDRVIVV